MRRKLAPGDRASGWSAHLAAAAAAAASLARTLDSNCYPSNWRPKSWRALEAPNLHPPIFAHWHFVGCELIWRPQRHLGAPLEGGKTCPLAVLASGERERGNQTMQASPLLQCKHLLPPKAWPAWGQIYCHWPTTLIAARYSAPKRRQRQHLRPLRGQSEADAPSANRWPSGRNIQLAGAVAFLRPRGAGWRKTNERASV